MTSNPTPTPLASTALEAAREIDRAFFDEIMGCISKGDPLSEYVESPQVAGYAAKIEKHFQSLLAKVEEENESLRTDCALNMAANHRQIQVIAALRADLAAEKATPDIGPDPLKLDGEERIAYRSDEVTLARLQKATSLQQKEVPDQAALVWRADLNWLIGQFIWRQAGHRHAIERNKRIEEELAQLRADLAAKEAALIQIFKWWDANDGHLTTAFGHVVKHKMDDFRALASRADKGGAT